VKCPSSPSALRPVAFAISNVAPGPPSQARDPNSAFGAEGAQFRSLGVIRYESAGEWGENTEKDEENARWWYGLGRGARPADVVFRRSNLSRVVLEGVIDDAGAMVSRRVKRSMASVMKRLPARSAITRDDCIWASQ